MNAKKLSKQTILKKELLTKRNKRLFQEVYKRIQVADITSKDMEVFLSNFLELLQMQEHDQEININVNEFCDAFITDTIHSYSRIKRWFVKFGLMIPALLCYVALIELGLPFIVEPLLMGKPITFAIVLPLSTFINIILAIFAFYMCILSLNKIPKQVSIKYFLINITIGILLILSFVFSQLYLTQPIISCNLIILYCDILIITSMYFYTQYTLHKV